MMLLPVKLSMLQNVNHSASFQLKPEDIVSDWDKEASRGTVKSL